MSRLRGYQRELQSGILEAWQAGAKCVVGVTATGSGKTVTMADTAKQLPGGIIQAHRAELVGQLSMALAKEGVRHTITASKDTVRSIVDAQLEEFGTAFYDPRADWEVASVDTLIKRHNPRADRVPYVFTDECFPAGTLIDGVPIEQIKKGDTVRAFDETTGRIVPGRVVATMRNPAPQAMVRVSVSHHVLECTNGHPFFTQRGWVPAALLTTDDHVVISDVHTMRGGVSKQQRTPTIPVSQDQQCILQAGLRVRLPDGQSQAESKSTAAGSGVHDVRQACGLEGVQAFALETDRSGVLQRRMCNSLSCGNIVGNDGGNQSRARIGTDDQAEPYARQCDPCKGVRVAQAGRACTEGARGQREAADNCRGCTACDVSQTGLRHAACSVNGRREILGVAESLQDRLRVPETQDSDRGGRVESQHQGAASSGCPQGCVSTWARVGNVEVFKWANRDATQYSDGGSYVYNFEVEHFHTYIAGGVVVHNCHHVLADNKWGRACQMFPNARILGMTATPCRADGKGLGRHHDGLADAMVLGPGLADLQRDVYLTGYDVYAPTASDLDISDVEITAGGEFNQKAAAKAVKRSRKIVGDIVGHYKDLTPNKLAIVFAADIEHAQTITDAFNADGIRAELVTSGSKDTERRDTMKRFKVRQTLVLVNVDLFGEGVDVPSVEVVIMARLTASFSLYSQQIGRMLRLDISPILMAAWDTFTPAQRAAHVAVSNKPKGVLIDHVGNVYREFKVGDIAYKGLPEGFSAWTLDRRGKRRSTAADDGIPMRMCLGTGCYKPYERIFDCCPYCNTPAPEPAGRSTAQQVDGNLFKLDGEILARMRGEIARIDGTCYVPQALDPIAARRLMGMHHERKREQHALRDAIAHWAGQYMHEPHGVIAGRFFHTFKMDTATAMTLGASEAAKLRAAIAAKLGVVL